MFAIAGNYTMWSSPDQPGVQQPLPSDVSVTTVPEQAWPLWHAAFGRDDLTGMWWYAPAYEAVPVIQAAIDYLRANRLSLTALVQPGDRHGVDGNRRLLERILYNLDKHPDNVIAVGRE